MYSKVCKLWHPHILNEFYTMLTGNIENQAEAQGGDGAP